MKYIVQTRYEHWKSGGTKDFTKWFDSFGKTFDTKEDAEKWMKTRQEENAAITKITKLKYEFQIIEK